jgi:hypothetical protein
MAYDPEARSQSNTAMIIGVVALVLMVGGALAYFSTHNGAPDTVALTPTTDRTVVVNQPAPNPAPAVVAPAPPVVIDRPATTIVTPPVTKSVETHTTVTHERVITPKSQPAPSTETHVTVNVPKNDTPPEPNKTTLQPQAGTNPAEPAPTPAQ